MNSIDAAYKVLREAGKPLHYAEITRRVVQSKLWLTSGRTPENTVNRDINQEILHRGKLAPKPLWIGNTPAAVLTLYAIWMWLLFPLALELIVLARIPRIDSGHGAANATTEKRSWTF